MDHLQKVLWHEGMYLTPNHFQQWDRANEAVLRRVLRTVLPAAHGLVQFAVDREALTGDSFALAACTGFLPDGTLVAIPDIDDVPLARSLAQVFPRSVDRLPVYLAAPVMRAGAPAVSDDPHAAARFRRRAVTVRDEIAGGAERDVQVAVKDLRILFGEESRDGFTWLKIAELVRSSSGGTALADDYVPPLLTVAASPWLVKTLRKLADIVGARAGELAQSRRQRTQGMVEFSVSETANYSLLHTLNGHLPGLMHAAELPDLHPRALYLLLSELAGKLYTYAAEGHPKELPAYDHDDLRATFASLDTKLGKLLETNITARYTPIALVRGGGGIHAGRLPEAVVAGHRFYLSIISSAATEKVAAQAPAKAKIASSGRIGSLVAQALKGIGLTYLSVPPGEIPAQPGSSYFELQRVGPEWDTMAETRTISIFLPPDFTDLKMEVMAVRE